MKILYVSSKYNRGKPELGYMPQHYNIYDTLVKINGGINEVLYFSIDEKLKELGREEMNKRLLETIDKEKPKLVFFVSGSDKIKKEALREITNKNEIITLNWYADDHWKFHNYSKYWTPFYDWVATTDPDSIPKYHKRGLNNVILSQWGCNHFLYRPLNLEKMYDVTFIGAAHGNRRKIIKKLKDAGISVKCWGRGWPAGMVSQEDMLKIWSQSKINLNFTKSSGILWKELATIFFHRRYDGKIRPVNPRYWLDNIKVMWISMFANQIKGRNMELPGCRTFTLSEYVKHLEDYYEIGKEIDCFRSIPELINKIKYYLAHEEEREAIAQAGYNRTISDHTWEKRFNKIFEVAGLAKE